MDLETQDNVEVTDEVVVEKVVETTNKPTMEELQKDNDRLRKEQKVNIEKRDKAKQGERTVKEQLEEMKDQKLLDKYGKENFEKAKELFTKGIEANDLDKFFENKDTPKQVDLTEVEETENKKKVKVVEDFSKGFSST